MLNIKKWIALTLATLTLLSSVTVFTGCGETADDPEAKETLSIGTNAEDETGEVDDRFLGVDYNDREFRIYTSNQSNGSMDSSNKLIEGEGKTGGDLVGDAVFTRNVTVEELLGVKLVFTQCELSHGQIAGNIRLYTQSGDDEFDLVVNDNYDFTTLLIEGHFRNILDEECVFDFERNYWYEDYMADLRLMDGYQYLLAGDFFIDVLRTAHLILVNKQLYKDYYRTSADELYDTVSNYEWTHEKLHSLIVDLYVDRNQDGVKNAGDQFGYADHSIWGASIPYATSGATNFITRDEDGIPTVTIQEGDRANQLAAAMTRLFNDESTSMEAAGSPLDIFVRGEALITGGYFLGSLENESLRQMESDAAVLPFPLLYSSDRKYVTATHDTTEMGAILITSDDLAFISTVTEVLNRETANILIPKYYKESIQVQCVDDEKAAAMIDIIHDNFDNSFILAYNNALNGKVLQAFSTAAESKREFSVVYAGSSKAMKKTMENTLRKFKQKNRIE